MNKRVFDIGLFLRSARPLFVLAVLLLFFTLTVYGQNTKGDQPSGQNRESRFKGKTPRKSKGIFSKRVSSKGSSRANRASQGGRVGKPLRPVYSSRPGKERAWTGDAAGNRVTVRSATSQTRNVYPQRGRFVNNPSSRPKDAQQKWRAVSTTRVKVRSATGKTRNVYPQTGRYVNNPTTKPGRSPKIFSNQSDIARNSRSGSLQEPPRKKRRVVPATASRAYLSRKSINPYAGFWNRKQKGERAYIGDISGRRLRTRNYQSPPQEIQSPSASPYYGRRPSGDRPYDSRYRGYRSATQTGKAWRGDIAGRKIRGRNFSSKGKVQAGQPVHPPYRVRDRFGDRPYKGSMPGGGYSSVSGKRKTYTQALPGKAPGIGARGIDRYQGNIRFRKTFGTVGADYAGAMKARKPLKGGGSVSGKLWNNNGRALNPKDFDSQGTGFAGNLKARRPAKGGGSVSGKLWNNNGRALNPKDFDSQGTGFAGNIKARRPARGGGSVSGKLWNNRQSPLPARTPATETGSFPGKIRRFDLKPSMRDQGEAFTGTIKSKRPVKGGGSVSGKLWNNNENPIQGKVPQSKSAMQVGTYQGNSKQTTKEPSKEVGGFPGKYRQFDLKPDMRNQGEEFTGYVRLSRFRKDYIKNPNASEEALKKARPDKSTYKTDGLQIAVKRQRYVENENSDEEALKKLKPSENTYKVAGLQVKLREKDYKNKPHGADGALPGIAPGKNSIKASEYSSGLRMRWSYKHNPSSADEALDVREPGKAFGNANQYQGNIKMKKFGFFGKKELHPDAQFVKTNKNNVAEERSFVTNVKLWWGRLFRKSETQPDHLKEKERKPRYDKGEIGLWYD